MTEEEFNALATHLRASWNSDRESWDVTREVLTLNSLCLRWDGDHRLLLEQHVDRQTALIAATYGRLQPNRVRSSVLLERDLASGRMKTKETSQS